VTDRLNFNSGIAYKRPSKRVPEKYLESPLRPQFDISDGQRPPIVLIPHRSLPVKFKDKTTEQWIVIPKGRLVSAQTILNSAADVFTGAFDNDGVALKVSPDASYAGVSKNTIGLLVPANGGDATYSAQPYSANDVLAEVPASSGDILASASGSIDFGANSPIGAVFMDIYQDIRGAYLNYDTHKNYAIVAQNTVQMPFVDSELVASMSGLEIDKFLPKGFTHSEAGAVVSIADASLITGTVVAIVDGVVTANTTSDISFDADHGLEVSDTFYLNGVTAGTPANFNDVELTVTALIGTDALTVAVAYNSEDGSAATMSDRSLANINIVAHGFSAADLVTLAGVTGTGAANYNTELTIVSIIDADNFTVAAAYDDEVGSAATFVSGAISATSGAGYLQAEMYFTFLTIDSSFAAHGKSGTFVKSDAYGNYVPEYTTYASNYRTAQTAGRILGLDARFPKDLLETVEAQRFEAVPTARVAGAATEGLSEHLFYFAYHMLNGAGYVWPTGVDAVDPAKKIREFVEAGAMGMALIQLSVR